MFPVCHTCHTQSLQIIRWLQSETAWTTHTKRGGVNLQDLCSENESSLGNAIGTLYKGLVFWDKILWLSINRTRFGNRQGNCASAVITNHKLWQLLILNSYIRKCWPTDEGDSIITFQTFNRKDGSRCAQFGSDSAHSGPEIAKLDSPYYNC